jgi:carboxypeptidase PM20D1
MQRRTADNLSVQYGTHGILPFSHCGRILRVKMKRKLFIAGIGLIIFIAILLIRTSQFTSPHIDVPPVIRLAVNKEEAANRLAAALKFKTVSHRDSTLFDGASFLLFHRYLEDVFPKVHATLKKETINRYSLLYTWKGREEEHKPILFMAHQDVVPVVQETEKSWAYLPFDGHISDGHIWGRGALDMKFGLMGLLEAIEALLENDFEPKRTIILAFGHDEEMGGVYGAKKIAEILASRKVRFEYVLDEGGLIVKDVIPGVSGPVALVGIAEKGHVSLELTAKTDGGHSSMPPTHTAVGIISKAIVKLEENPFPSNMTYAAKLFEHVGPHMPYFRRIIFANMWLFNPLVKRILSKSPETNATIRTTTAATMFHGGEKENVLPIQAKAVINFRIMPGENVESVVNYARRTIDAPNVKIRPLPLRFEPSPVSDVHSKGYGIIRKTIHQIITENKFIVAPYLVVGGTDSRYVTAISDNVYRFVPVVFHPEDVKRIHGTNERISIENYVQAVKFYYHLIRNSEEL